MTYIMNIINDGKESDYMYILYYLRHSNFKMQSISLYLLITSSKYFENWARSVCVLSWNQECRVLRLRWTNDTLIKTMFTFAVMRESHPIRIGLDFTSRTSTWLGYWIFKFLKLSTIGSLDFFKLVVVANMLKKIVWQHYMTKI